MVDLFGQGDFGVRFEWGQVGAEATRTEVAVVVDVLSFSTSVAVAVERGMRVFPYRWKDARAQQFAAARGAVLAVGRLEATKSGVPAPSLSPAGLLGCPAVPRLVLPSPNGSTIAAALVEGGASIAIGCLRNAQAVANWLAPAVEAGRSVAVIAAGERWGFDDSLRPAVEDQLGAGAILSALVALGYRDALSPEARTAADLFDASRERLTERIHNCVSGRELTSSGFASDIAVAVDLNSSSIVPVLVDGAFEPSSGSSASVPRGVPAAERQRVAVYGVARRDDAVLLTRASADSGAAGTWWLPGGGLKFGESPTECLAREFYEETGHSIRSHRLMDVLSDAANLANEPVRLQSVRLIYEVEPGPESLRPETDGSTDAAMWVPIHRLNEIDLTSWLAQFAASRLV